MTVRTSAELGLVTSGAVDFWAAAGRNSVDAGVLRAGSARPMTRMARSPMKTFSEPRMLLS
jgi:hypothetical protein